MSTATLSQPIMMAGMAMLGSVTKAGQWAFARYMRAPLASTGLLAMVTMTALAGSNALYFQTGDHPSPFFAPARSEVAALPTPSNDRPESVLPAIAAPQTATAPAVVQETTGNVTAPVAVPNAPVGNAQMFAVQKKLFELNLFSGTIDGYYGPKTAEAIRAFETRNGMTPTGAMSSSVMDAILSSDGAGRTVQPAAPQPQPVVQPQAVVTAPVAQPAPQQDEVVARLPDLSPAEQAFDVVAQSAANTIDSIISTVDTSRGSAPVTTNPPVPLANVAPQPAQAMPQPVAVASTVPPANTASTASVPRTPPANDTELVRQIQTGLASLGFFQSQVDGKPGPETARAIREFESFNRYRMTGQVQPDLVDLLIKAGATI